MSTEDLTPRVAILVVGDELLDGRILDTNSQLLARVLRDQGAALVEVRTVRDEADAIASALRDLSPRVDLLLSTGGLGPTVDDRTRSGIADAAGAPLERRPDVALRVRAKYESRGRDVTEAGLSQADLPRGARCLVSDVGTADAFEVSIHGTPLLALPGVPRELRALAERYLPPRLPGGVVRTGMEWRALGIGESELAERVDAILHASGAAFSPSYLAASPYVRVRIQGGSGDAARWDAVRGAIDAELAPWTLPDGAESSEAALLEEALKRGWSVASAESCTGGRVAARWTAIPGASACVRGAIVAYANDVKHRVLRVDAALLEDHGAVRADVALAMARGARAALGADAAVATTGIAGPGAGPHGVAAGQVFVGVVTPERWATIAAHFVGRGREGVTRATTSLANEALRRALGRGATAPRGLEGLRSHGGVERVDCGAS